MRVAALYIHPVKAMRAVPVDEAVVTPTGLRDDRRWMVVDERGDFLTQREEPALARISARVSSPSRNLELSAPGRPDMAIDAPAPGAPRRVRVWGDECEAISAGTEVAAWLSEVLGRRCELVYLPAGAERVVDPEYATDARVGFADGFPFLIATTASLADVNARLERAGRGPAIDMRRFRPNIVVEGSAPFEEDAWRTIACGDVRFSLVKPCGRCVVITVDPDTAERGKEPLATMARYRTRNREVYFGQNAVLAPGSATGRLRVGDPVAVIEAAPAGAVTPSVAK